ncbi:MAG: DNA cytosine methyltransferase, partial [Dehalococcoidia bacterium]|nr:DNA cytosine methyltransferase [Dehalococcoidia bacterium]
MTTVLRAAEFFAGIGLMRLALEAEGVTVVWANDISPAKQRVYTRNFPAHDFHLGDVRAARGADLPPVDLATASFPCTDVSLAGARAGLAGAQSGMVWEFLRVVAEMPRRPPVVLLENVLGLATSHGD